MGRARGWLGVLLLTSIVGCSGEDGGDATGTGGSATGGQGGSGGTGGTAGAAGSGGLAGAAGQAGSGGQGGLEVSFYACAAASGFNFECAKPELPLDPQKPSGKKVTVFIRKALAKKTPVRGQLWVLQGGPGVSTTKTLAPQVPGFAGLAPDLDVYFIDHRGTGLSSPLDCAALDATGGNVDTKPLTEFTGDVTACLKTLGATWSDAELAHFSAEDAGRDLGELIDATRKPGEQVFVMGLSYGTRWAQRYLRAFPTQASGVVLDGIVADDLDFASYHKDHEEVAKTLFSACDADAFCKGKLPGGAYANLAALIPKLEAGHCPTSAKLTARDYRHLFRRVFQIRAALLPPLVYRVARCDAADQDVILKTTKLSPSIPGYSVALHYNVALSELNPSGIASDAALDAEDKLLFSTTNNEHKYYRAARDLWPEYAPKTGYPVTQTPMLLLNGTLDGQTTLAKAQAVKAVFTAPKQTFVAVQNAGHGVGPTPCGSTLITAVLAAPDAAVDASCAATGVPLDFEKAGQGIWYGPTGNTWENP